MTDNEKVMNLMKWFSNTVEVSTQLREMILRIAESLDMGVTAESLPTMEDEIVAFVKSRFVADEDVWSHLLLLANKVG